MVREIVRDPMLLAQKSEPAVREDMPVAQDLLDTLKANRERCVGMAANMIGVRKRIIAVDVNGVCRVMLNPRILAKQGLYAAQKGCLSELLMSTRTYILSIHRPVLVIQQVITIFRLIRIFSITRIWIR